MMDDTRLTVVQHDLVEEIKRTLAAVMTMPVGPERRAEQERLNGLLLAAERDPVVGPFVTYVVQSLLDEEQGTRYARPSGAI